MKQKYNIHVDDMVYVSGLDSNPLLMQVRDVYATNHCKVYGMYKGFPITLECVHKDKISSQLPVWHTYEKNNVIIKLYQLYCHYIKNKIDEFMFKYRYNRFKNGKVIK